MIIIFITSIVAGIALIIIGIWLFKTVCKDLNEYNSFLNTIDDNTKSSELKSENFKNRKFQLILNLKHVIMKIRMSLFAFIIAAITIISCVISSCNSNKQSIIIQQYEEKISQKDSVINILNVKVDSLIVVNNALVDEVAIRDKMLVYEDSLKQVAAADYNKLLFEIDNLKTINKNLQNAVNLQNEMIKNLKNK